MKRSIIFFTGIFIAIYFASPLFAVENAQITGDSVRIREAPRTTGAVIATVSKGTRIEVTKKSAVSETINGHLDFWYAVLYNGKNGFVFGQFIALDAGVTVPVEGVLGTQTPTNGKPTLRPEDIIGDWAVYSTLPPIVYSFEPGGFAQYLSLAWDVDFADVKIARKYLTVDLVRGQYTIDGTTVRVTWFWGDLPESVFSAEKNADGVTLTIDGKVITPRTHTREPGKTSIGDIIANTEPDM
jgi:hypothetical protein